MIWLAHPDIHPEQAKDLLGYIPSFLNEADPRTAKEQFDANYGQGGGWRPMQGFKLTDDNTLEYPGDPPLQWVASALLHEDEMILVYRYAWVAIVKIDRSYEVARLD